MPDDLEESPEHLANLLRRWQAEGDREALDELLAIEIRALKRRIRARSGHADGRDGSASDIAQEATYRLLRVEPPPVFEHPNQLRAYLWTSAWRLLAEQLRARAETPLDASASQALDAALQTTGGVGAVERRDRAVALELALNLLEPKEKEILDLVVVRGLGNIGAAEQLGISAETAKDRCRRARARLERKLKHWNEIVA